MPTKEELIKKIVSANKAYRDGLPIMSDQEFDDLCEALEFLMDKEEYSAFRNTLHEEKGKVKHPFIMGSLDKLKHEEPAVVKKFIDAYCPSLNISAKIDGISCRLHYKDGQLVSATTRGNGEFGEDISDKIQFVKYTPNRLLNNGMLMSGHESLDIRGELVILKKDFSRIEEKFANPRNAVAGIMNRKEWNQEDVSDVSFIAYTILGTEFTKETQFELLDSWGFKTAWNKTFKPYFFNDNKLDVNEELFKYASQEFEYETDGLVICDRNYRNEDKYRPDACKAFKINQQVATTRLIDVDWGEPSKDGFFCPVAVIDPVELGGATISRVTLHNLDNISAKNLMYGSIVKVKRSGDVIPYLEEVVENPAGCIPITYIDECPICGAKVIQDGLNLRCTNKSCKGQALKQLADFIKKLGVKSASEATLENFKILSFKDLVAFKPNDKYKSQKNFYSELMEKMFTKTKRDLLAAMNFIGLSTILINKIVDFYGFDDIAARQFNSSSLPVGIGSLTLDKFIEGLDDALANVELIASDSRWSPIEAIAAKKEFKGSICVSGSLAYGSRSKFLKFAEAHGYEAKDSIVKGLTYLVCNDTKSGSSKVKKALANGVKILTEDEFMKLAEDKSIESSLDFL